MKNALFILIVSIVCSIGYAAELSEYEKLSQKVSNISKNLEETSSSPDQYRDHLIDFAAALYNCFNAKDSRLSELGKAHLGLLEKYGQDHRIAIELARIYALDSKTYDRAFEYLAVPLIQNQHYYLTDDILTKIAQDPTISVEMGLQAFQMMRGFYKKYETYQRQYEELFNDLLNFIKVRDL